ncbi:hypothetical protein AB7M56_001965 [Bradyrhizobium elkanii]|nr:hypothetical protein [Bradyrhizobium elkanii]MCS3524059.1 hypothetical protein [Bradyrhizobium elkanii]MCS4071715.1 hypothetical protein [Bradyrhizobium elkanii]MCS4078347.1 hypothetical protein [Bradyrhizobium elkanii]MCS4110734.1 hypothetical protein [Bradyrhizobium elkanii]
MHTIPYPFRHPEERGTRVSKGRRPGSFILRDALRAPQDDEVNISHTN